ncbi:MAG TPA: zf-HC2 domain-containing protein [Gemmatimonadaceae bacterium]|nr:zf-HC2 domain-containing protein [Gemmatimonadaceae bacterium]
MTTPNSSQFDCGQFADALADVLEREVSEPTRSAVEAHALACAECGALLADLRKLRIDAANLPALTPSRDLWNGIADRIETPVVELGVGASGRRGVGAWKRRVAFGIAAAALVAVTATITHELTKRSMASVAPPVAVTPSKSPTQPTQVATISPPTASTPRRLDASTPRHPDASTPIRPVSTKPSIEQTYSSEIKRLRTIVNSRRGDLDSGTVAVIDKNLAIIDNAIVQCRIALAKDPHSRFLIESLNDALDTKVQLLRTAAALPTRM